MLTERLKRIILVSLFVSLGFCARNQEQSVQTPVENPIIASVGERAIDWKMLRRSYHLEPKWERGLSQLQAYQNQLDYLIAEKAFAQAARDAGLDQPPSVAFYLNSIKEKEMMKELYQQEVESKVKISDEEYQRGYASSKKTVKFEYIYTFNEARAAKYRHQLENGSLADLVLTDPTTEEKGTTPMFSYGDMAEELEDIVYDLELNQTAGPVKIDNKWMVVKLIDGEVQKFMSEMDFAENKSKVDKIIFERRARVFSDEFVQKMLTGADITIDPAAFALVHAEFSKTIQNKDSAAPFPIHISDDELKESQSNLDENLDRVLVDFSAGQLTIRAFLTALANLPRGIRPQVKMAPQLKKAIALVIRNYYLTQEAYRRGLDHNETVQYETAYQVDQVLANRFLNTIRNQVSVTPEEIEAFRQKANFEMVNQQLDNSLDDPRIMEILADVKFQERQKAVADSLRQIYPTTVDTNTFFAKVPDPNAVIKNKPIGFTYVDRFF